MDSANVCGLFLLTGAFHQAFSCVFGMVEM